MRNVINLRLKDGHCRVFEVPKAPKYISLFNGGIVQLCELSDSQLLKLSAAWRADLIQAAKDKANGK